MKASCRNLLLLLTLSAIAIARGQETDGTCSQADGCSPQNGQRALLQVTHSRKRSAESSLLSTSGGINPSGSVAPLTQEGYAAVADRCCQAEMEQFIERVAFELKLDVCNRGGIHGLAPFHTCEEGPQTYNDLTSSLLSDSAERCSAFAPTGTCKDIPADCPTQAPKPAPFPDCFCSASKAAKLVFTRAFLGQNNLGGIGPDTGVQEMRYINVFAKPFPIRWTTHMGGTDVMASTDICIDVHGGEYKNGASVATFRCAENGTHFNMQWTLPASGTGVIRWTPHPDKCFQVAGGSQANGANLELWDCDEADPNQQFIIPATVSGPIKWATHPTKCVAVDGGGTADHTNIEMNDCVASHPDQQWTIPKVSDGVDLVITTLNAYAAKSNGGVADTMKNGFGSFTVRKGTSTDFKFKFVESGTTTPKVLEEFHMTFSDLDGAGTNGAEFVSGKGYKGYITDTATSLTASTLPTGYTKFSGTVSVPNPTSPGVATDAQRKGSVMFFFRDTSEFQINFGFEGPGTYTVNDNAELLFSGSSALSDQCEA